MEKKELIGKVTHFFDKISVVVIKLTNKLSVGDEILIQGTETNFTQKVESMQVEHKNIEKAKAGDEVGMKVSEKVKENDSVYRIMK